MTHPFNKRTELLTKQTKDIDIRLSEWLPDRNQPHSVSTAYFELSVSVDVKELKGKTVNEIKNLVRNRILSVLYDAKVDIQNLVFKATKREVTATPTIHRKEK